MSPRAYIVTKTVQSGKRWVVRYKPRGSTRIVHWGSYKTKKLAETAADYVNTQLAMGRYPDPREIVEPPHRPTVLELLDEWIASWPNPGESTRKHHRQARAALAGIGTLSRTVADAVTTQGAQEWVNALAGRYAPATARKYVEPVRAALDPVRATGGCLLGAPWIVRLAQTGDPAAIRIVVDEQRRHATHLAYKYFARGLDRADLEQEALVGVVKALRDYRSGGGASWPVFAHLCMERQVQTAVVTQQRGKHRVLTEAERIDAPPTDTALDDSTDLYPDSRPGPHQVVASREALHRLVEFLTGGLSGMERVCLVLVMGGASYHQIQERTGLTFKAIDNAVQRARRKTQAFIEETA